MKTLSIVISLWMVSLLMLSAQTAVQGGGYLRIEPQYKDLRSVFVVRVAKDGTVTRRCAVNAGVHVLANYEPFEAKKFGELLKIVRRQTPKARTIVHVLSEEGKGFEKTLAVSKVCLTHGVADLQLASGENLVEPKELFAPLDLSKVTPFEEGAREVEEKK